MAEVDITARLVPLDALPAPSCSTWSVKVVAGPDDGAEWKLADIAARRVLIGCSPACDLRLSDQDVARRHAALEYDDRGLRLIDLDSVDGTWLGPTRIRDAYLNGGDTFRIGHTSITVETDGILREVSISAESSFGAVIGISPQMRALFPAFAQLAASEEPVLIEGESGTGKELVAESMHRASPRRGSPFIVFDCRPGAGAVANDVFDTAKGGTLFLDEISDLNTALQARLMRALDSGESRILAATRRDLDREVQAHRFSDDLFQRLAKKRVELPPLRKRMGGIVFLARLFLVRMGGDPAQLTPELLERLTSYDWPGNVRELKSAIAQLIELGDFALRPPVAGPGKPSDAIDNIVTAGLPFTAARDKVVEEFVRRYVEHMLNIHGGNVTRAAAASGIGRRYFQMVSKR